METYNQFYDQETNRVLGDNSPGTVNEVTDMDGTPVDFFSYEGNGLYTSDNDFTSSFMGAEFTVGPYDRNNNFDEDED